MKTYTLLSTVLATLLAAGVAAGEDKPCTIHGNGKYFDLTPLKSPQDFQVTGLPDHDEFHINMCQPVKTETFGLKDEFKQNEVASFIRREHGDFVIGKVEDKLDFYLDHPRLLISSGSRCKSSRNEAQNIRASALIDFRCDPSAGRGQPRLIAQLPPGPPDEGCAYVIEWRTQHACPTSESGIVWTLFITLAVVFLTLLLAYTILGTLYNRFVLQLRGVDQIPQFSIESMRYHATEAIDWAKDVFVTGYHSRPGASGGFFGVPGTPNPVSHQTSVGINIRDEDLESRGGRGFVRPHQRTSSVSSTTATFSRTPQRSVETNPVSHQSQVNAELENIRIQSLSQPRAQPQTLSQSSSSSSSSDDSPLINISDSRSPPAVPPKSIATPTTPSAAAAAASFASRPAIPPTPATADREFQLGDDDDDEEQDYNEYNMVDDDAKELSDFKRPGSVSTPTTPKPSAP
ncbi:mannose 6-phosphate receptor domain-containing protein [Coprinopsis marcescibilis]|uniref:Autophagy-related protein 27 n=1 Tax=Coprinopsis marcescibilis TaxID=230819 RepID=A0A5C3KLX1_COPMA|nr:mannose 6-phosphate receptor domain-containing protein [Coprinopsis marcescibilis]